MTDQEIYQAAIDKWGDMQIIKAIEEMSELQKELCKVLIGKGDLEHIAEEIADVRIMLGQMTVKFDICQEAIDWRREKMKRLEEILRSEVSK